MVSEFHMIEAAARPRLTQGRHAIFVELIGRAEPGLEMRFAKQRGVIAVLLQPVGDSRCFFRQTHAVHPDAVTAYVLPGNDRRARWHADNVLIVRSAVVDAGARQSIEHRGACHNAAVATQRVVTHLIGGDQQDLATHAQLPAREHITCSSRFCTDAPNDST